jgi:signal transduction histidine kinase
VFSRYPSDTKRLEELSRRFRRFSLAWLAFITVVAGIGITLFIDRTILYHDLEVSARLLSRHLDHHLRPELFQNLRHPQDPAAQAIFKDLGTLIAIRRMKLVSPEGVITWSDEAELIARKEQTSTALERAYRGQIQVHFEHLSSASFRAEQHTIALPWVSEMHIPLRASGRVAGVVEIYHVPLLLTGDIVAGLAIPWTILVLAAGVYFGLSNRLMLRTSEELIAAQADSERNRRLAAVGQFVSIIVHDTRNLLASIRFACERLASRTLDSAERTELAESVRKPLELSLDMMTDLLDFASNKARSLRCEQHALAALVEEARAMLAPMAESAGHRLLLRIPEQARIYCDAKKFTNILINLVRNSVEAMSSPGEITIEAVPSADRMHLCVRDTGPGIDEKLLPRIFEPFVSQGKDRPGLGLAIIRDLVQRHGGEITAGNGAQGGAEFVLTFPASRAGALPITSD